MIVLVGRMKKAFDIIVRIFGILDVDQSSSKGDVRVTRYKVRCG